MDGDLTYRKITGLGAVALDRRKEVGSDVDREPVKNPSPDWFGRMARSFRMLGDAAMRNARIVR